MTDPWILRPIRHSDDESVAAIIRDVMTELGCGGQGFAIHDAEVDHMSESYQAADACYLVLERGGQVLGGAGFARLAGTGVEQATCELRKMYFRPAARGSGQGRAMITLLLEEMKQRGYRRCYLETTSWMQTAQALYRSHGFAEQSGPEGQTGHHACDRFFARSL
jgi:putative acetyltransferase